jgi:hypothetical protein
MRVCIVHYHFRRGGVTRVTAQALEALKNTQVQCCVLSGEPVQTLPDSVKTGVVEGLCYHGQGGSTDPDQLAEALLKEATRLLGCAPDVWHIHNPTLGKNMAISQAIVQLAQQAPVLMQCHDFAEDGRAVNYARLKQADSLGSLYPVAPQVHFAVLNGRDHSLLAEAGYPDQRLHLLPNPVTLSEADHQLPPGDQAAINKAMGPLGGRPLIMYPTRAIRRKNLGEWLLWAALMGQTHAFATTLTPDNPEARAVHDRWVQCARDLDLPVVFGLAERSGAAFSSLLAAAEAIGTTSVAEGFGMAFLEPFLAGKPLCGRDLPDITQDFKTSGLNLESLYARLDVPVDWVGETAFKRALKRGLSQTYQAYGQAMPEQALTDAFEGATASDRVDFGRLDEPLQEAVLKRVCADPGARAWVEPGRLNPRQDTTASNAALVAEAYSLGVYQKQLTGLYQQLSQAPLHAPEFLDPARVLSAFLQPERFQLLRT